ncbi:SdiA-regulated domain-containing protein [Candidatus Uabimicrobium amorphum]|uniref:Phytase-like domain-containing protein n=1 Tax=Uabimicrobium amorphum TaxID=2596890 RepID=A0A5S9F1Z7_UABAM|nr:SdiA-regulated domain-containing protein [Candidatus Uabimicrobium amorphum]BBM83137.1 hypothetical protein UABAM_01488 [Candidatus Uabimicrobium amorphum]
MLKIWLLLPIIAIFTLELQKEWLIISTKDGVEKFDPSGLTLWKDKLITVSDKSENSDKIYELVTKNDGYADAKPLIFLNKEQISQYSGAQKYRVDFEGVTNNNRFFYICDERNRNILQVSENGDMQKMPIDFYSYTTTQHWNPFSGVTNAGFEGIAYDKHAQKMYVLNERMYRHIYEVHDHKITSDFDVPSGNALPRYEGKYAIYPDFSGAYFDKYLYVIYRNEYKILCIDPQKKSIVSSAYYGHITKKLYHREDPFGLVEGIAMTADKIFLIIDNNGIALHKNAAKTNSILLQFKRPKGF